MRLRLSILRHELPVVKILWHIPSEPTTVSKLLERISDVVPLESDGWGVEDYVVHVNSYECLHYLDVHKILNEDDEVSIHALQTSDIRIRTVSGRHQISAGGAHLIDGVAFGRTYYKRHDRPPIRIPPLKRRHVSQDDDRENGMEIEQDYEEQLDSTPAIEDGNGAGDEDEEEEQLMLELENPSSVRFDELPESGRLRSGKRRKSVSFDESSMSAELEFDVYEDVDENESDDQDFEPTNRESTVLEPVREDHLIVKKRKTTPTQAAMKPFKPPRKIAVVKASEKSDSSSSASSSSSSSESSDSDSERSSSDQDFDSASKTEDDSSSVSSDPDSDSSPEEDQEDESRTFSNESLKHVVPKTVVPATSRKDTVPGQGKTSTKARNQRRKAHRRAAYLREHGLVNTSTTAEQMRLSALSTSTLPTTDVTKKKKTASKEPGFEERRQELLNALAQGGIDVHAEFSPKLAAVSTEVSVATPLNAQPSQTADTAMSDSNSVPLPQFPENGEINPTKPSFPHIGAPTTVIDSPTIAVTPTSQAEQKYGKRVDLASSRRLLFGSLGVRIPRTKAEEEKLRTKLSTPAKKFRSSVRPEIDVSISGATEAEYEPQHVDSWKGKIKLSAVECIDPSIILSNPPFPFVQRWDQQQKKTAKKNRKRKRASQAQLEEGHYASYDESYMEDENVVLDYNDPPEEYSSHDANQQLQLDIIKSTPDDLLADDLPHLPADITTLPYLVVSDLKPTAVIAFKQLECTQATNWAPTISPFRTAVIISITEAPSAEEAEIHVTLATRDQEKPDLKYDGEGNRVYGKFEVVDDEDDDAMEQYPEDGGERETLVLTYGGLIEPKLVRAAPEPDSQNQSDDIVVQDSVDLYHNTDSVVALRGLQATGVSVDIEGTLQDSMFTNENVVLEDQETQYAGLNGDDDLLSMNKS